MKAPPGARAGGPAGLAAAAVEALCLSLAVIVPLHFNRFSGRVFENHKAALLLAGAIGIGVAWMAGGAGPPAARARRGRTAVGRALLLFAGAETLSTLCSVDPWLAFRGSMIRQQGLLTSLAYLVVFGAVVRFLRRPAQRDRLLTAMILASVPVCLYGLAQRSGLDPVSWGESFGPRVSSTLGNPIFLGAYAAMMLFPTLARWLDSARAETVERLGPRSAHARAVIYGLVAGVQAAALLLSGSRGPMLAAGAGGVAFAIGAARALRPDGATLRRLSAAGGSLLLGGAGALLLAWLRAGPQASAGAWRLATAGLGLLLAAGLLRLGRQPLPSLWPGTAGAAALLLALVLAAPTRPAASRPGSSGEARRGILESVEQTMLRRETAVQRTLYWRSYLEIYLSRTPIRYAPADPTGPPATDRLRPLRPFVGYGPEVAIDIFQQHFPSWELSLQGPTGSADRAHNETWDRLVAGGLLGLIAWLFLLTRMFQVGLGAAGFAMDRARRGRFTRFSAGGAVLVGIGALLWPGPAFFGAGFQTGLSAGILVYLACGRLRRGPARSEAWGLLAGLLVHVVEATVGFGVTATRLSFWLFAGLLVAGAGDRRAERSGLEGETPPRPAAPAWMLTGIAAGVLALDFLGHGPVPGRIGSGPMDTAGVFDPAAGDPRAGALLVVAAWLWCLACAAGEAARPGRAVEAAKGLLISAVLLGAAWLAAAAPGLRLSTIEVPVVAAPIESLCAGLVRLAEAQADRALWWLGWWGVVLALLALALRSRGVARPTFRRRLAVLVAAPVGVALIWLWSLQPVRADILDRAGMIWRTSGARATKDHAAGPAPALQVATAILLRAAETDPRSADAWFRFAEAAAAAAVVVPDAGPGPDRGSPDVRSACGTAMLGRTELFSRAAEALERSRAWRRASPLVALNLAHVHRFWAAASEDPEARENHGRLASAWLGQAQRMFGPGIDLEDWLRRGAPGRG